MKSLQYKDKNVRVAVKKKERKIIVYKFLKVFLSNKKSSNVFLNTIKFGFLINQNKTRLVNRCILTNRSRGVLRAFKINRMLLKAYFKNGNLPGYSKALW